MDILLKKAKTISIFDKDGNELTEYKAVVNEEKHTDIFQVVSNGYTIVQHSEVMDIISKALEDRQLEPKRNTIVMNNGGRIREEMLFNDIRLDVENDGVTIPLIISQDNSYDGTTGLRLEVGAVSRNKGFLWIGDVATYYHRHTKGIKVKQFEKNLDKAIDDFQDKIKNHFMRMLHTPVTQNQAEIFIEEALEDKKYKGADIYLKELMPIVKSCVITTKWQLYCLICDSITKNANSIDNRNNQLSLLVKRLHFKHKSVSRNDLSNQVDSILNQDDVLTLVRS